MAAVRPIKNCNQQQMHVTISQQIYQTITGTALACFRAEVMALCSPRQPWSVNIWVRERDRAIAIPTASGQESWGGQ